MSIGLTPRQAAFLEWLLEDPSRQDMSFEEMRAGFGLSSKSGVFRLLNALEDRGYVRRLRNRARSLELLAPIPQNLGLQLVAGPSHFERLAEMNRRTWALQERVAP